MTKYLKLARTSADYQEIKLSDPTLPLVAYGQVEDELTFRDSEVLILAINNIAGEDTGATTTETNYIDQIDNILGEEL